MRAGGGGGGGGVGKNGPCWHQRCHRILSAAVGESERWQALPFLDTKQVNNNGCLPFLDTKQVTTMTVVSPS